MAGLDSRSFDEPDDVVELELMSARTVILGEVHVGWIVHQPGWSWSEYVKPVVRTPSCLHHHQGVQLTGRLEIVMAESGARRVIGPGEAFDVPPGHDARVLGDEPVTQIDFAARGWGKPSQDERVVATLLVTDIVGSTEVAARLGDVRWKELLARHGSRARIELDRFRGMEVATTGDGFLAMFDGAARAVRCAAAIGAAAPDDGLEVRAGVHSGEVERDGDNLRGLAVHAATRIASLAGPGQVLVSAGDGKPAGGLRALARGRGRTRAEGPRGYPRLFSLE